MFENATVLAGVGGAAVPVALHLLSRAQYKPLQWGAMMFLEGEATNELRSAKLKRWLLLGLRMLAVGLLAVALARPVVRTDAGAARQPVTSAIVVDCSSSMDYDEGGRTRMDLARGTVLQILSRLGRGDQAVLVPAPSRAIDPQALRPSADLQSIATRVADLESTRGPANLAEALTAALDVLERASGKRQLYVVCDRQAASWSNTTDAFISAWRDRISKGAALDRFAVIPVGGDGSANVGIESVQMESTPVIRGIANRVQVKVHNFSDQPRPGVAVNVIAGQRQLLSTSVNLPAGASATVSTALSFPYSGSQILTATIKARGLEDDDRLDSVVNVADPIRTLIVSGDRSSQYASAALAPYRGSRRRGNDPATVDEIDPRALGTTALERHQVIVLADVALIDEPAAAALERFVRAGGGLLVTAGDQARTDVYTAALYRDGAGLLPAALSAAEDEVIDAPLQIDAMEHPMFTFLQGATSSVPSGAVRRKLLATASPNAQVLARLASGAPLLIERAYGRGRVLVLTTDLGMQWGRLPQTPFYVPFVQSMVKYLAGGTFDKTNVRAGEEIVATLESAPQGRPTVSLPDGATAPCDVLMTLEGRSQLRFGATQQPGIYRVRARVGSQNLVLPYMVQSRMEESDLTPLPPERWDRLATTLGFIRADRAETAVPIAARAAGAWALWLPLVLGVIGVLVLEMALSRRWSA